MSDRLFNVLKNVLKRKTVYIGRSSIHVQQKCKPHLGLYVTRCKAIRYDTDTVDLKTFISENILSLST